MSRLIEALRDTQPTIYGMLICYNERFTVLNITQEKDFDVFRDRCCYYKETDTGSWFLPVSEDSNFLYIDKFIIDVINNTSISPFTLSIFLSGFFGWEVPDRQFISIT